MHSTNPDEITIKKREMYAKMALIMFYPFRELSDLTCIGESYWRTFHHELTSHHSKKVTKFWKKGFEILQNIQDRLTLQKHLKCPQDPIIMTTVNEKPNEEKKTKPHLQTKKSFGHTASGVTTQVSELNYHHFPIRNKMFCFCEMFYFYLTIYYSTAEWSDETSDSVSDKGDIKDDDHPI